MKNVIRESESKGSYTFSKKTENRLNENQKEILCTLIDELVSAESWKVENTLWNFTQFPGNAMFANGFFGCNLNRKQIQVVCKEIIKHYKKHNPDWSFGEKQDAVEYQEIAAVHELEAKVQEKGTVFMQIFMHTVLSKIEAYLSKNCEYNFEIERAVFLLNSDKDRMNFGGLLEIGFKYQEAKSLKPYAKELGAILEECYHKI